MSIKITKSYSPGYVCINRKDFHTATLKAARRLDENEEVHVALDLLKSQDSSLSKDEAQTLLQALRDAEGGYLREYSVETDDFRNIFSYPETNIGDLPESGNPPKLYVVLRGGVVQYIAYEGEDTPAVPKADVIDLDDHEPTWSQEDLQRIEGQIRIW